MVSNVASTAEDVCQTLFADVPASSEVYVAGFPEQPTEALVNVLAGLTDPPSVHLLAPEGVLRWLRRDFHSASTAADLRAAGTLSFRNSNDSFGKAVVTEKSVVSIVTADERVAGLETDDAEFTGNMREKCSKAWEIAESFDLRTPPRSRVYETMGDELGDDIESDYRTMLDAVGSTRSGGYGETDDDTFDEIELSLLVGAKHRLQHYNLSKWGEDIGLTSKATFSRAKNQLEDQKLLTTEKVPIDVGRPRQRLVLDDRLRGVSASELPEAARSINLPTQNSTAIR